MRTPELDAAFRATRYRVETAARAFDLHVGVVNPAFDEILRGLGASRWGLLTAYNPGGVRCDDDNARRQRRLLQRVERQGWRALPAGNYSADGRWPVEPSVLVLQISEAQSCALAAEFLQLAVVCGEVGAAPRLVWL